MKSRLKQINSMPGHITSSSGSTTISSSTISNAHSIGPGGGVGPTTNGGGAYPSISAAYWLPAPNPTPYLLPGMYIPIYSNFL